VLSVRAMCHCLTPIIEGPMSCRRRPHSWKEPSLQFVSLGSFSNILRPYGQRDLRMLNLKTMGVRPQTCLAMERNLPIGDWLQRNIVFGSGLRNARCRRWAVKKEALTPNQIGCTPFPFLRECGVVELERKSGHYSVALSRFTCGVRTRPDRGRVAKASHAPSRSKGNEYEMTTTGRSRGTSRRPDSTGKEVISWR
jgi:hypothetical protein